MRIEIEDIGTVNEQEKIASYLHELLTVSGEIKEISLNITYKEREE